MTWKIVVGLLIAYAGMCALDRFIPRKSQPPPYLENYDYDDRDPSGPKK
jgi:hypothetical protein